MPVNRRHRLPALLALMLWTAGCAATTPAADPARGEAWRSLFDGRSLAGWHKPYEWGDARVENGEIVLQGDRKFFLVTRDTFRNFVFEGEVLLPDTASNAGFMFRAQVEPNRVFGYQAEVDPKPRRLSGGLYDEGRRGWLNPPASTGPGAQAFAKGPGQAFRPGEWNRYRIEAVDDRLRIWVNEVLTTDLHDATDREGVLGIQHHGEKGKVYRYRNLRVRELP